MDRVGEPGAVSPTEAWLWELHARYQGADEGAVATYIPELAKANPAHFGICLTAVDGKAYAVGDCDVPFTIQSVSKPFVFGLALEDHGRDYVLGKIGVEPSGDAFNSITFDKDTNRPLNPMVNAGAIAAAGMVKGRGLSARASRVRHFLERFAGRDLAFDEDVFLSERRTGHRNRAIAHLERNFGILDDRVEEHLDLYFMQCSLLVTARDLGMMAATLANGGINPRTGRRALDEQHVKYVLAVMSTCGMYDFAGEWLYRIGLPAKSGVGGGIIAVLPGQFGIATFSPRLDAHGNSVRGLKVFEDLSHSFDLHMFDPPSTARSAVVRHYRGDQVSSERIRGGADAEALKQAGGAIAIYELQGDLILASVEQLVRRIYEQDRPARIIIMDLRRVWRVGDAAAMLIARTIASQEAMGCRIVMAGVEPASECGDRLIAAGVGAEAFAGTLDAALEWAENRVLREVGAPDGAGDTVAAADMEIFAGLSDAQLAEVTARLETQRFAAGEIVFREGAEAECVYFLAAGQASIVLNLPDGTERRLAGISPGACFGEMAAFDGKPRSADVRADSDITCLALPTGALRELARHDPALYAAIMENLVRMLVARLRRADAQLKALR